MERRVSWLWCEMCGRYAMPGCGDDGNCCHSRMWLLSGTSKEFSEWMSRKVAKDRAQLARCCAHGQFAHGECPKCFEYRK